MSANGLWRNRLDANRAGITTIKGGVFDREGMPDRR
jgi:hypothetical protein